MNKIALICGALLAAATTGCQTTGGGTRALNQDCPYTASTNPTPSASCHGGCTIWVEVVDSGGTCKVVIGTTDLIVKVKDAWVVWWLPDPWTQNFELKYEASPFTAPVIFEDPYAAQMQFSRSHVYANGTKVRVDEQGNNGNYRYPYKIRVYKRNTSTYWEIDPAIVNEF